MDDGGSGLGGAEAASAISPGVIGRLGVWSGVVRLPVTAQVMMVLRFGGA